MAAKKRLISSAKPQFGNSRSFSMRANRRKFNPNMQTKHIYVPELGKTVTVCISVAELKTIDKIGFVEFAKRQGVSLKHFAD
jgi:large subunit ribosomal protein L28